MGSEMCIRDRINRFYLKNRSKGWDVAGFAVDQMAPVQAFLKQHPVDFSVPVVGIEGLEISRNLGNLAGGLPFSVVIDAKGQVVQRKLGSFTAVDLDLLEKVE